MADRIIRLEHITKIEGHAKLVIGIENESVTVCELSSVEGSRYFEGIVRNHSPEEAFEITSRICGICSSAHVLASISAAEKALSIVPSGQTLVLRRLLNTAERIRSHTAHLYFLALPDYLGYGSALEMVPEHRDAVKKALKLMKTGNDMNTAIGGRVMHPVSAAVGGWRRLPDNETLSRIKNSLNEALPVAYETFDLFNGLEYPKFRRERELFSLIHDREYPQIYGNIGNERHCFTPENYRDKILEKREDYSTANFCNFEGKSYMVGALSRLRNNQKQLHREARPLLNKARIDWLNPFHNNLAQAIETVHVIHEAIEMLDGLEPVKEPLVQAKSFGRGVGAIEAPRGILIHDYTLNDKGIIKDANIITPTAHNLLDIQENIRSFVPTILHLEKEQIVLGIEKLIRAYDPCFSCASHFLEVEWVKP